MAVTASSKQHVDALNDTIQHAHLDAGHLDATTTVPIGGGEHAHVGDVVVTRRNDGQLVTDRCEAVDNQDHWQVTGTRADGAITVNHTDGRGTVALPAGYVAEHVRLGYAATEYGHEGDTVEVGVTLTFPTTTHRGLYVATTRGRDENRIHVVTQHDDPAEARDILDGVLVQDRADHPATTQRAPARDRRAGTRASG